MAYTTINKSTDYFNTKIYAPDGSSSFAVTGVGFQPDWVWLKSRGYAEDHQLNDSVRGATKGLQSNLNSAETTQSNGLTSFDSDGFTVGNLSDYNWNGDSIVSWNWLAGGTASSNYDGSITSTVSVNTTAGFSIVKYTGTGANATIGHGLGVAPKMIIVKAYEGGQQWAVQHSALGATKGLRLNSSNAAYTSSTRWNNTEPTASVFTVGTEAEVNTNTEDHIAYCFAEKQGYSKFGSYTGNGNASGPFVYTGFKPAWVMTKRTDSTSGWIIRDNKRDTFNPSQTSLYANAPTADDTSGGASYYLDFLSNGFKFRGSGTAFNASSGSYIYMAFAAAPLVGSNNIPATAR